MAAEKIKLLRELMGREGYAAVIIGSEDAHISEYVSSRDERRSWLTEFSGSAGTAVVTVAEALLWTDGRYFVQAEMQLSSDWTLMKSGEQGVPTMEEWISGKSGLPALSKVGVDPFLLSMNRQAALEAKLSGAGLELAFMTANLVDEIWSDQPAAPCAPVMAYPVERAGRSTADKLSDVRASLGESGAKAMVVTALDDVCWLFNIRGADVSYNPVVIAYGIIFPDSVKLLVDEAKLGDEVKQHLAGSGVEVCPYSSILDEVSALVASLEGDSVLCDPQYCNAAIAARIPKKQRVEKRSPIQEFKGVKNPVELEGMRQAHIRDGVALTSFLAWLEKTIADGGHVTEVTAADKLEELRSQQAHYVSLSFSTIAGYAANGAIIHYRAETDTAATLGADSIFLLDSGAQYLDGTTDVTRTVHMGTPTDYEKECYTLVLKGHIGLATAVFPEGVTGTRLDTLARLPLWQAGLDYRHGTGHGVGAFLNVHEGPQGIGYRIQANEAGMKLGMITSNEPGYYEDGKFGIRIESLCECVPASTPYSFGGKTQCKFETITVAPIQTKLVTKDMLSPQEVLWLNDYNSWVREKLAPLMKSSDAQGYEYLLRETEPI